MSELIEKCRIVILQIIALVALNILGFYYDSEWLYACIAVDLIVLGVDLKILHSTEKTKRPT